VDRQLSSVTRLAVVALLVGVAAIGCGNRSAATPPASIGSTPAPQATAVDQPTATLASTPTDSATDAASTAPTDSAAPSATTVTGGSNPQPTTDPVTTDITNLNNIINGINGSVSGGDAGTSGGE
jgi:cytoskeletal protein RodZ